MNQVTRVLMSDMVPQNFYTLDEIMVDQNFLELDDSKFTLETF